MPSHESRSLQRFKFCLGGVNSYQLSALMAGNKSSSIASTLSSQTKKLISQLIKFQSTILSFRHSSFILATFCGRSRGRTRGRFNNACGGRSFQSPVRGGRHLFASVECQIHAKLGHSTTSYWHRANISYQPSTPQALPADEDASTINWFLDSGASNNLKTDAYQLQSSQHYFGNLQVQVGNGHHLPIAHSGQVFCFCRIHPAESLFAASTEIVSCSLSPPNPAEFVSKTCSLLPPNPSDSYLVRCFRRIRPAKRCFHRNLPLLRLLPPNPSRKDFTLISSSE
ncbi:hypothetical protein M5K25_013555 [Dendrobium thyrsiflorum]|uniref:Uncharacterized protein n=1 Tax=Dendrobium thyrsiflorum TaxID=117978 RepID=A0ABD0UU46_DENTH